MLSNLSKNKDIIVTSPDKGQGVSILNRNQYIDKTERTFRDTTMFTKIEDDCTSLTIILNL